MSKRKGMTLDDKRAAMLDIFQDSRDVYVIKDIEKLSIKKGIIQQAVKDVLQSLVDDDLVRQEKIGISNYYWSFPSEASVKMESDLAKLEASHVTAKKRKSVLQESIVAAKAGKEETKSRTDKMQQLQAVKDETSKCDEELAKYKENDPEMHKAMLQAAKAAVLSANRWTDNLDCLMTWSRKTFEGHKEGIASLFKENGADDLNPF